MSLFELAHDAGQPTPVEVAARDGQPYLRLRPGAAVTPELVRELNDLIGLTAGATEDPPVVNIASIPVPRGIVCVGRRQHPTCADLPVTLSLVGRGLTDTADLTVAAALAIADTLVQAALKA